MLLFPELLAPTNTFKELSLKEASLIALNRLTWTSVHLSELFILELDQAGKTFHRHDLNKLVQSFEKRLKPI